MYEGLRVLDLSRFLAGPYGTLILGDLGAEIIKIEPPQGDSTRQFVEVSINDNISAYFVSINRNKKSIVIDLNTPEGKAVFYDLVKVSDVVYDNFRPGILEKLKIDYDSLKNVNPRIICCSISGYGQTGPHKDRPAFDLVLQAISGEMSITGEPSRPPVRMGIPMGDLAGGLFGTSAIGASLWERERTGKGQKIDLSLLDCQISLMTYVGQYYFTNGIVPEPIGSGHQTTVPYQAFKTKDEWIVIACFSERFWNNLCNVLGISELITDSRFDTDLKRVKNRNQLIPIMEEILATKPAREWLNFLEGKVPVGPVNTLDKALSDPQVLSREMVVDVSHPAYGQFKMLGNPVKSSSLEKSQRFNPPPLLGQDTELVLQEILNYSVSKINELVKIRAVNKN